MSWRAAARAGSPPRQDANLLRWGYPYVLEDFRFHMTLTERLGLRRCGAPRGRGADAFRR